MEDDFHHFAVTLRHDGKMINDVSVDSIRVPWATCPTAAVALAQLAGHSLIAPVRFNDHSQRHSSCTHMLDLANFALAHVHEPGLRRRYDLEVDFPPDGSIVAWLNLNGARLLDWKVVAGKIIGGRFNLLSPDTLPREPDVRADPLLLEAVIVMRRALQIARGRFMNLDSVKNAAELGSVAPTCYTLLPTIRTHATREQGATRDFSGAGRWPLSDPDKTVD